MTVRGQRGDPSKIYDGFSFYSDAFLWLAL